jgi:hypothetical protein
MALGYPVFVRLPSDASPGAGIHDHPGDAIENRFKSTV